MYLLERLLLSVLHLARLSWLTVGCRGRFCRRKEPLSSPYIGNLAVGAEAFPQLKSYDFRRKPSQLSTF